MSWTELREHLLEREGARAVTDGVVCVVVELQGGRSEEITVARLAPRSWLEVTGTIGSGRYALGKELLVQNFNVAIGSIATVGEKLVARLTLPDAIDRIDLDDSITAIATLCDAARRTFGPPELRR